ncbi:hypothetical protein [Escherichia coli]|uniref:hypothetical protein n=1 Tax=Escherichia coli TaxID=562 RepID=UPI000A19E383|nr:hypothetical protein [Escherichia coli]
MKDKSFIMLCTPGYIKKTGYYFRAERDKDVLQSLNFKEKGTIVINSLKKIINTVLLIKKIKIPYLFVKTLRQLYQSRYSFSCIKKQV